MYSFCPSRFFLPFPNLILIIPIFIIFQILYSNSSFFSSGNLASFSSFELNSVYRFTTIFSPFLMTTMLVIKILIPMILILVFYLDYHNRKDLSKIRFFFRVSSLSDILSLHFFFLVQNTGSWLEIGNSISRFCLCNLQTMVQMVLFILVSFINIRNTHTHKKNTIA